MKITTKILGLFLIAISLVTSSMYPGAAAYAASGRGIDVGAVAYVWPGDPYLTDMLDPTITPVLPSVVVVNIGNGEGDVSILDQTADALRARTDANGENVKVIGYVYTSLAQRDINAVKANVDSWLAVRDGKVHYDGIFFDETTRTCGSQPGLTDYRTYYRQLRQYVWNKLPNTEDLVVNNPGTAVEDCMLATDRRTADIYVTFEGTQASYAQIAGPNTNWVGYTGGNVFNSTGYRAGTEFSANSFWHMIYNTQNTDMQNVLTTAFDRYAGTATVTDDYTTNSWLNPWDAKPSYLNDEVWFASQLPL